VLGAGDLFVTNEGNFTNEGDNPVLKLAVGSSTQTVLPFTGLNTPGGVGVDSAGNLYVADFGNSRVLKLSAGSSSQEVLPFTGLNQPEGVAVDTAGNVYVADSLHNRVVKLPAVGDRISIVVCIGVWARRVGCRSCISGGMPMLSSQRSLAINHCRASQSAASARLPGAGHSRAITHRLRRGTPSNVVHMSCIMSLAVLDTLFYLHKHWLNQSHSPAGRAVTGISPGGCALYPVAGSWL